MAEIASTTFSQTDGSNTGALPGLSGASAPNLIDDSIRAMMGATKREHDWRNFTVTSGGSSNAYTLTYTVAPTAYYTGQRFGFITNFSNTSAATVNVNALGAKTIKKMVAGVATDLSSGDFASGDYIDVVYNGTNMIWINKGQATTVSAASDTSQGIVELATTTEVLTGTDTARAVTPDALAALWEKGSDIASAGTLTIGEGEYFHVTGTTTITDIDFGTAKDGRKAILVFDGALTLTHNATTLILPGGASITTAAGDSCMVVQDNADNVKVAWYQKASGAPIVSASNVLTYIGTVRGANSNQDLTGIGQFTSFLIKGSLLSGGGPSGNVTVAISEDNGSSFGTARTLAASGAAHAQAHGSAIITGVGSTATNKVVTPAFATADDIDAGAGTVATYTTTATESTKTGITNALRFVSGAATQVFSFDVFGIS